MRAIILLELLMLTVPAAALAGGPATPDESRRWVCVKKPADPPRAGQRTGQPTLKCRWVQRVPAVVDPFPISIL